MRSPLETVLANTFVSWLEKQYLMRHEQAPSTYVRYMGDTFCLFNSREHMQHYVQYCNTVHPSIRFTYEDETNGQLPFLDVLVSRSPHPEGQPKTSIYRKSTLTGLYTHFSSFTDMKLNCYLIRTLSHRALLICSDYTLFDVQIQKIVKFLTNDAFPVNLIYEVVGQVLSKFRSPSAPITTVPRKPVYLIAPFLGPESFNLKKETI